MKAIIVNIDSNVRWVQAPDSWRFLQSTCDRWIAVWTMLAPGLTPGWRDHPAIWRGVLAAGDDLLCNDRIEWVVNWSLATPSLKPAIACDQSMKVASGEASIVLAWLTSLISNRPLSKRVALPSAVSSNLFKSLALIIVFSPLSVPLMVSFSVTSCE